jgi:hypothetical protein
MLQSTFRLVVILTAMLLCGACVNKLPDVPLHVTPTPNPTPVSYEVYTSTLNLPGGRILPVKCVIYRIAMGETRCDATFPNGNLMEDVSPRDFHYSPDQQFAVRECVRTTHDSSCLGGQQVWNMVDGVRLRTFPPATWYAWVPGLPHTLAHIEPNGWPRKLFFWNLETGDKEFPIACPDWIKPEEITTYDAHDLVAFCEDPLAPTITPES